MKTLFATLLLCLAFAAKAQDVSVSGLNARQFHKYWKIESESPHYCLTFQGDTAEIVSPQGLTLWRKEKMHGNVTIEYDACVVVASDGDRLSDLNCFWMASDPQHPDNLWARERWRSGIFLHCYSLQLYYLGYGGNHNTTTRFRRYDGDEAGITDPQARPAILKEYTDADHLLKPNHWYHIKITNENHRIRYYIDGQCLVDFRDAQPLTEGWFGFRTTLSRTRITNFRCHTSSPEAAVPLQWIGDTPQLDQPVSFGVPFEEGKLRPQTPLKLTAAGGADIPIDTWPLAYWPDGSVKWVGVAGRVPAHTDSLTLVPADHSTRTAKGTVRTASADALRITEDARGIQVSTGVVTAYIPRQGQYLIDSLLHRGTKVGEKGRLVCRTQSAPLQEQTTAVSFRHYDGQLTSATLERAGRVRATVRLEGNHRSADGRTWLPFTIRLYFYAGSEQIKLVHSFVYDGEQEEDFIQALGIRFDVPLREALYNRHVAFSCAQGGVWSEPVQPLVGRRVLTLSTSTPDAPSLQQQQMQGKRIPPVRSLRCQEPSPARPLGSVGRVPLVATHRRCFLHSQARQRPSPLDRHLLRHP